MSPSRAATDCTITPRPAERFQRLAFLSVPSTEAEAEAAVNISRVYSWLLRPLTACPADFQLLGNGAWSSWCLVLFRVVGEYV